MLWVDPFFNNAGGAFKSRLDGFRKSDFGGKSEQGENRNKSHKSGFLAEFWRARFETQCGTLNIEPGKYCEIPRILITQRQLREAPRG